MEEQEKFKHIDHICSILSKYDPVGLVFLGAPSDEYSPEAVLIFFDWRDNISFDDFNKIIFKIFSKQFRVLRKTVDSFIPISQELWSYLKRNT